LRPTVRANWIALAVACHLAGNLKDAKTILEYYEQALKTTTLITLKFLYHARILEELGTTRIS